MLKEDNFYSFSQFWRFTMYFYLIQIRKVDLRKVVHENIAT